MKENTDWQWSDLDPNAETAVDTDFRGLMTGSHDVFVCLAGEPGNVDLLEELYDTDLSDVLQAPADRMTNWDARMEVLKHTGMLPELSGFHTNMRGGLLPSFDVEPPSLTAPQLQSTRQRQQMFEKRHGGRRLGQFEEKEDPWS